MLYNGYLIVLDGHNIIKKAGSEISIFELPGLEICRLCPSPQHPNRVTNTQSGHLFVSVHWNMYRGRGAGRWDESSAGASVLPYSPPACAYTAARRDELEGTKSLPCLPCRAPCQAPSTPPWLALPAVLHL